MSKSTLYDIANEFEKSLDNLLDHDDSDLIKEIESIEGEFKLKSANVAKYIRNLEHLALGIKEIESSQKDRRISLEKKIARLKDYLRINFEKTNTPKTIKIRDITHATTGLRILTSVINISYFRIGLILPFGLTFLRPSATIFSPSLIPSNTSI